MSAASDHAPGDPTGTAGDSVAGAGDPPRPLGALLALQADLLELAPRWAAGEDVEKRAGALRHDALRLLHRHYLETIDVYRQLARNQGIDASAAGALDTLINQMMFDDTLFKSYPPELLKRRDYPALGAWLGTLCSQPVPTPPADVADGFAGIADWRAWLARQGLYLNYSSGTSGRLSLVPRDPMTWRALRNNARAYADQSWFRDAGGGARVYDCLIAGPPGQGMGIQGAAAGLARTAQRVHYLYPDAVTEELAIAPDSAGAEAFRAAQRDRRALDEALAFARRAGAEQRPLLLFGAPFQLRRLCEQVLARDAALTCAADSIVVSGGGWKSFGGERLPQRQLFRLLERAFGIDARHVTDSYSTTEMNCAFTRCAEGSYHIPPLIEPLVLDEAFIGEAGATGAGTFGFLDPFALSYPGFIITGDRVTLRRDGCPCGRRGWRIAGEIVRNPDREVKGCGGVLAALAG